MRTQFSRFSGVILDFLFSLRISDMENSLSLGTLVAGMARMSGSNSVKYKYKTLRNFFLPHYNTMADSGQRLGLEVDSQTQVQLMARNQIFKKDRFTHSLQNF